VVAVGHYELFIDDRVPLPAWLVISDIDSLKHRLISVVIAAAGVAFLGKVVLRNGEQKLQSLGITTGAFIAALTYLQPVAYLVVRIAALGPGAATPCVRRETGTARRKPPSAKQYSYHNVYPWHSV
jgi:uncharacterized membrane protein YqhA